MPLLTHITTQPPLRDKFHPPSEQASTVYRKTKTVGAKISLAALVRGSPYWKEITTQSQELAAKNPILLCDYQFKKSDYQEMALLYQLIAANFKVFILTAENQLLEFDGNKILDRDYIKTFLSQLQPLCKTSHSRMDDSAEKRLQTIGENINQWNILDNYAIQELQYVLKNNQKQTTTEAATDFSYALSLSDYNHDPAKITAAQAEKITSINIRDYSKKLDWSLFPRMEQLLLGDKTTVDSLPSTPALSKLKKLNLLDCKLLHKKTLTSLMTLGNLESLTLYHLINLEQLLLPPYLKDLTVDYCPLIKTQSFTQLAKLTHLEILTLTALSNLKQLPSLPICLKELVLENLEHLSEAKQFSQLQKLTHIENLTLKELPLEQLPPLPVSLKTLKISKLYNKEDFSNLATLTHLEKLNLTNVSLSLERLALPSNLKELTIEYCALLETTLNSLAACSELKSLKLTHCKIKYLPALPMSLEYITITESSLGIDQFMSLAKLPRLKKLTLAADIFSNTVEDPVTLLERLLQQLSPNTELVLSGLTAAMQKRMIPLEKKYPQLTTIPSYSSPPVDLISFSHTTLNPKDSKIAPVDSPDSTSLLSTTLQPKQPIDSKTAQQKAQPLEKKGELPFAITSLLQPQKEPLDTKTATNPSKELPVNYVIFKKKWGRLIKQNYSTYRQHVLDDLEWDEDDLPTLISRLLPPDCYVPVNKDICRTQLFTRAEIAGIPESSCFLPLPFTPNADWVPLTGLTSRDQIDQIYAPRNSEFRYNLVRQQYEIRCTKLESDEKIPFQLQVVFHAATKPPFEKKGFIPPPPADLPPRIRQQLNDLFQKTIIRKEWE